MTKEELKRLSKDQERLRIAYDILECLESMIFYRGPDNFNPRVKVMRKLAEMTSQVKAELEREEDD